MPLGKTKWLWNNSTREQLFHFTFICNLVAHLIVALLGSTQWAVTPRKPLCLALQQSVVVAMKSTVDIASLMFLFISIASSSILRHKVVLDIREALGWRSCKRSWHDGCSTTLKSWRLWITKFKTAWSTFLWETIFVSPNFNCLKVEGASWFFAFLLRGAVKTSYLSTWLACFLWKKKIQPLTTCPHRLGY